MAPQQPFYLGPKSRKSEWRSFIPEYGYRKTPKQHCKVHGVADRCYLKENRNRGELKPTPDEKE